MDSGYRRRLPKALRAVAPFGAEPVAATPLSFQKSYAAPAGSPRFAAPTVTVAPVPAANGRAVTLTFHGSAKADRMFLLVPKEEGLLRAEIDGHVFLPAPRSASPFGTIIACMTADCRNKSVTLVFWWRHPIHIAVGEQTFGLPPDGAKLASARPPEATPSQTGDSTIVFAKMVLR